MRLSKVFLSLAAPALVLLFAPRAGAVERESHLGFGGGVSVLSISDKSSADVGGGLSLYYTYGLTDQWNLLVQGGVSLVSLGETADASTPKTRPTMVSNVSAGIGYVFDILSWVPYVGVLAGGYVLNGGTIDGALFLPGASVAVGLDYRLSRKLAVGIAGRQHFFFTEMNTYPSFTDVFAKVEYSWGW